MILPQALGHELHREGEHFAEVHGALGNLHREHGGRGRTIAGLGIAVAVQHGEHQWLRPQFHPVHLRLKGRHGKAPGNFWQHLVNEFRRLNSLAGASDRVALFRLEGQREMSRGAHGSNRLWLAAFAADCELRGVAEVDGRGLECGREVGGGDHCGQDRCQNDCQRAHYQFFFGGRLPRPSRPRSASKALRGFSSFFKASSNLWAWRSVSRSSGGNSPSSRSSSPG